MENFIRENGTYNKDIKWKLKNSVSKIKNWERFNCRIQNYWNGRQANRKYTNQTTEFFLNKINTSACDVSHVQHSEKEKHIVVWEDKEGEYEAEAKFEKVMVNDSNSKIQEVSQIPLYNTVNTDYAKTVRVVISCEV